MYITSTINPLTKSANDVPVLLLCYNQKQTLIMRPKTYADLSQITQRVFSLAPNQIVSFETSTLDICKGRSVVIDEGAYEVLSPFLDEIGVVPHGHVEPESTPRRTAREVPRSPSPVSQRSNESAKAGKTSTTTQASESVGDRTIGELRNGRDHMELTREEQSRKLMEVVNSWSGAEEEAPIIKDSGRREQERSTSNESKGVPSSTARKAEQHTKEEQMRELREAIDSLSGTEDEVPIIKDSGRRESERSTSNESKGVPLSTARKQSREEKSQGPSKLGKNNERWETISPAIQSTKSLPQEEAVPPPQKATGNRLRKSLAKAEERIPMASRSTSGSAKADQRFNVTIYGPRPHQEAAFKTRGQHLIKKVLAGACKTFNLDVERARLLIAVHTLDEEGDVIDEQLYECDNEATVASTGIDENTNLIIKMISPEGEIDELELDDSD